MEYSDLTSARILADSISDWGHRITTLELTFPRFILAEFNTHKSIARNSASSRAIPTKKQIEQVEQQPFIPTKFPINKAGMSAEEYVEQGSEKYRWCEALWLNGRDAAVSTARNLSNLNVHKQIASRVLEPYMWHTVIATATWDKYDWPWIIDLRTSEHAQPEIKILFDKVRFVTDANEPHRTNLHLPLVGDPEEYEDTENRMKYSVARCAAVSYNRHLEKDHEKEIARYEMLKANKHWSPFEHVAHAVPYFDGRIGPFTGWQNLRSYVEEGDRTE